MFGASVNSTTVYAQESDNQEVLENDNEICDNESDEDIVFSAAKAAANTYTREVSEYDMLKAAQKASNVELKNNGFTEADIIALKKPLKGKEHYGKVTYTISCLKFKRLHIKRDSVTLFLIFFKIFHIVSDDFQDIQ